MPATYPAAAVSRRQITIEVSAPFELVMALGSVNWRPYRHRAWVDRARDLLGAEFMPDVEAFSGQNCLSITLTEFPVDFSGDSYDIPGFIDYVEAMSSEDFMFYLAGRVIAREYIPESLADPQRAFHYLSEFYNNLWSDMTDSLAQSREQYCEMVADIKGTQRRAVRLLRAFYDRVFKAELPQLRQQWAIASAEQRDLLDRMDPEAYVAKLLNNHKMPTMFPEGTPLREIRVIPTVYAWKNNMQIWGYGSLVVLFDANMTEVRRNEIDQDVTQLTKLTFALADATRVRILRTIVQENEAYGHKLAKMHGISQPAVSRHMGILKDAGLVTEEPRDGRINYRLNREPLANLSRALLHFIED